MQNVTLVGALQGEPELRFTGSGKALCNFSIRTVQPPKQGQERVSEFFDCTIWEKAAENFAETFRAKDRVIVIGKIRQEKWQKDGVDQRKITIQVQVAGADTTYNTVEINRTEAPAQQQAPALATF